MGGALFQYGTAVHLALLTVAPLFLSAFLGPFEHALFMLGLSLFSLMWVVMNPAPREGEWPRDARRRIGLELARDPFLYAGAAALLLAIVRAINGGISMEYDAAQGLWSMSGPAVSLLPGSVVGEGVLPLAGVAGTIVATLGVRHALGGQGRFAYLLSCGLFAVLAVGFWRLLELNGVSVPRLRMHTEDPFSLGSLLGVYFVFALISWVASWTFDRTLPEFVAALFASALLEGILLYAPLYLLFVFGPLSCVIVALGVIFTLRQWSVKRWLRSTFFLAIILLPVALSVSGLTSRLSLWPVFPDGFGALRATGSDIAIRAWKVSSQLGVGLGAYPLARDFFATPEDWQILSVAQTAAPNGWAHFLFERGFLGCAVLLVALSVLVRDIVVRFVRAGSGWTFEIFHFLGPTVLLGVVAVLFVDCTYVQPEALIPVGAALALTAAALPERMEEKYG